MVVIGGYMNQITDLDIKSRSHKKRWKSSCLSILLSNQIHSPAYGEYVFESAGAKKVGKKGWQKQLRASLRLLELDSQPESNPGHQHKWQKTTPTKRSDTSLILMELLMELLVTVTSI